MTTGTPLTPPAARPTLYTSPPINAPIDVKMMLADADGGVINQTAPGLAVLTPFELQLLQNEKFYLNLTQMLNISAENLTNLLMNVQQGEQTTSMEEQQQQQQQQLMTSHTLLTVLTVCYALIFVAGVLGNLVTCIVISRNNFMHTATNFYLFNLAVSDLILLLSGMPQDLYNLWQPEAFPFTDTICVIESVLCETAANATVLTITAFTVERYIAICHPFRQHTMSKLSRAIKFIFAIWLTAFLLALPQAMQFAVMPLNGGTSCTMHNDFFAHVFAISGFIFFGGPMTAICVLYVLIGVKLKRSRLLQALPRRSFDMNRGVSAQSRVIRMLVAVAVAFFLCWAPFHAQRLMAAYGSTADIKSETFNDIFNVLNYTSGVLYFLSTCINPLLYNIMSHKFREAFKVTLARHFGLSAKYQTKANQHHNYSALLRQNGSMRLHTTVNNNACEHFGSYPVSVQFQCRDPSHHHLSLQDSIRTTTTTTTMNSLTGSNIGIAGNGSRRSSQRNRCVSIGSQSTLTTALSKHDMFAANTANNPGREIGPALPHRVLQTQISQLSSVGDANSLLEADIDGHAYTQASRRSLMSSNREIYKRTASQELPEDDSPTTSRIDCRPTSDVANMTPSQPLSAIAELNGSQPSSRARLKLSRIIRRQDAKDASVSNLESRTEMLPTVTYDSSVPVHMQVSRKPTTLDNLREKFGWSAQSKPEIKAVLSTRSDGANDANVSRPF